MVSLNESGAGLQPLTIGGAAAGRRTRRSTELMSRSIRFVTALVFVVSGVAAGLGWGRLGIADDPPADPPRSLNDPRLSALKEAAETWATRPGPTRRVVDQVCLVPDLPTFLEAIGTWDREHWFPVLFDEPESALRFVRAFRPARVVRMPSKSAPIANSKRWEAAARAVEKSWSSGGGDDLGATPPGVVLSRPGAGMLAGAVALAAGRFEPLVRWDPPGPAVALPKIEDLNPLLVSLEVAVGTRVPRFGRLGDDCDFLTLAGGYPAKYRILDNDQPGQYAFDDLVGRRLDDASRWAFAGRLVGGPAESTYAAMCALFLQPESALLFDGYAGRKDEWAPFRLGPAAEVLRTKLDVTLVDAFKEADLDGWRRAFGIPGPAGLVMANSSGAPDFFNLPGKAKGAPGDIPIGPPVAVSIIHSFSAARPEDTATIAGRWRANGAYLYLGSVNEPYLQAFRSPTLVADLLAKGVPAAAAARKLLDEDVFGKPWRLTVLGDPLYRLDPEAARVPRLPTWDRTADWPAFDPSSKPPARGAPAANRLGAAFREALATVGTPEGLGMEALRASLTTIPRASLDPADKANYDALLAELVVYGDRADWEPLVRLIPEAERTGALQRAIEARASVESASPDSRGRAALPPSRRR